jgi:adenylate cyclase
VNGESERIASDDRPAWVSADELAIRVGIARQRVDRLADLGIIDRDARGRFDPGDVHRVRLLEAFEAAGVPLDALLAASRAGRISLAYYDQLHPPPGPLSAQSYDAFVESLGAAKAHLPRLFAAFGLAEPAPETRLTIEAETLVRDMLETVVATGQPDLALRAIRPFGEAARRAADGAMGAYAEAVEREGDAVQGLPVDEVFDRLLRSWARFARLSATLAGWLASHHLSRAIDEYSVTTTEQVLEETGFVAARLDAPPAVSFVDLTGFTRLTEERGDEAAAGIAMRLGEVTADVVAPRAGRVVKLLGDGVLIRFADATTAVEATLDLLEALPRAGLPSGHAGVASGPLIMRDGDVFGRTVNTAARIADVAPDGRLYVADVLASALPPQRYVLRPADGAVLQGIGPFPLVDVTRWKRR